MGTRTKIDNAAALSDREIRVIEKVLADPRRFEIFRHIASMPAAACCDLLKASCITPPTLSHHLKELESSGLVEITRSGKFLNASINRATWEAYLAELKSI